MGTERATHSQVPPSGRACSCCGMAKQHLSYQLATSSRSLTHEQGLRLVWADREADTALFELLSDIPPAWEAALQGWDARGVDRPREEDYVSFYNYNFPSGDAQKFTSGM